MDWPTLLSGFASGFAGMLTGGLGMRLYLGRIGKDVDIAVRASSAADKKADAAIARISAIEGSRGIPPRECAAMREGCAVNLKHMAADIAETRKDIKTMLGQVGRIEGRGNG